MGLQYFVGLPHYSWWYHTTLSSICHQLLLHVEDSTISSVLYCFLIHVTKCINGESIVLCGDGRNDLPGHSGEYCVYVLMEQFVSVVVDIDVVDKQETGGVSTNMEVYGLKKLLERVVGEIVVAEIVTDASTAVIALAKMKGTVG